MVLLIAGLLLFILIHTVPWSANLRLAAINKIGLNPYKGLFSLGALIGLILIVVGKANAEYQQLWALPTWGRTLTYPLMFIALFLVPAANIPTNLKRLTRHPMLWGVVLWSIAHLAANGDLASVLLFGSLGLYAALAMVSANKRGATVQTQAVPFKFDLLAIALGVVANAGMIFLHPDLFGIAVMT